MRTLHLLLLGILLGTAFVAGGGEIIFVDPLRDKVNETTNELQPGDSSRLDHDQLREQMLDAARAYRDESPAPPTIIMKGGAASPSEAAQLRDNARSWSDRKPSTTSPARCVTGNTVGEIEGSPQGRTVIQGNSVSGKVICK